MCPTPLKKNTFYSLPQKLFPFVLKPPSLSPLSCPGFKLEKFLLTSNSRRQLLQEQASKHLVQQVEKNKPGAGLNMLEKIQLLWSKLIINIG